MTCLKQGIKAVKLTSVMRTFPDADKENGVSPHHNLQHYLQCFSDRPPKPSKEHSQCHAQSTASSRGSYKQVPMPNSSPGHCPAFCQCGTPVHGILYQYNARY